MVEIQQIIVSKTDKFQYIHGSYNDGRKYLIGEGYKHTNTRYMTKNNSRAFYNKLLKCWIIKENKTA